MRPYAMLVLHFGLAYGVTQCGTMGEAELLFPKIYFSRAVSIEGMFEFFAKHAALRHVSVTLRSRVRRGTVRHCG